MWKFLSNFVCLIFCLVILEYNLYMKDHNELLSMCKYVIYDVNNSNLKSFYNDKFTVIIYEKEEGKFVYEVAMKRESLFNIKRLKIIKYDGLVN